MAKITIKSEDTAVTFTDTLQRTVAGVTSPVNLTGASVLFILRRGATTFSASATVVNPLTGEVSYTVGVGFPIQPGEYRQEWEVTFANATKLTFPSDGWNDVTILEDLN